ncbi:hypothetical protein F3Y22_tig00110422pilonHSYRG00115 [Hibiscus syriacus]|uniref:GATA-type domain-containing protein n=1 Tax=Hibiscus syriacus TaxID=106335 RepID=A0A6A3AN41_HIBSY|nr:hypothetical protein F3Y22_tig00110422pilonHSYRG00115 [Hibiscus syriacus]
MPNLISRKKRHGPSQFSNATSGGTHDQIKFLVSQGCIKPLCDLLNCPDPRIVTVCLEGLENILKVGEADKNLGSTGGVNVYAQMIDDAEGLEKIENLQSHDNTEIYEKAVKILETYWLEEEEETLLPADASQTGPYEDPGEASCLWLLCPWSCMVESPVSRALGWHRVGLRSGGDVGVVGSGGPAGPKSLCNACGIKYRKKRRAILGLNKSLENKKVKWRSSSPSPSSSSSSTITTSSPILTSDIDVDDMKPSGLFNGLGEPLEMGLIALSSQVLLRSSSLTWMVKKQRCQRRRKFGEEEENAAVSLMALSYGLVFA